MFLVTTALEDSCPDKQDILLLGKWCILYGNESTFRKQQVKIVPYHWNDRNKLKKDYEILNNLYEKYLAIIYKKLNKIHKVHYSKHYWRIIIGRWLMVFMHVLYDRYETIKSAVENYSIQNTVIHEDIISHNWCSENYKEFEKFINSDTFNHYLYAFIIQNLDLFDYSLTHLDCNFIRTNTPLYNTEKNFKVKLKTWMCKWFKSNSKVVFVDSGFGFLKQFILALKLRQLPISISCEKTYQPSKFNQKLRQDLEFEKSEQDTDFEKLFKMLLPDLMPKNYIEDYMHVCKIAYKEFPRKPQIIFTSNPWSSEYFSFWSAYCVDKGAKLCISQSGGNSQTTLLYGIDEHEIKISARYYLWGDNLSKSKCFKSMPSIKLNRFLEKIAKEPESSYQKNILWLQLENPRYPTHILSAAIGPQMHDYFSDQHRFYSNLSCYVKKQLLIRFAPSETDSKWQTSLRWTDIDQHLQQCTGTVSYFTRIKQASLIIVTYNATCFLEALVSGKPIIAFWNPKHWELKTEVIWDFNQLKEAGILFDCPAEAAEHINKIILDIDNWWKQSKVQKARQNFIDRYTGIYQEYLSIWVKEFKELTLADN